MQGAFKVRKRDDILEFEDGDRRRRSSRRSRTVERLTARPFEPRGPGHDELPVPEGGPTLVAEVVPYVVLPGGTFRDQTGLAFGDVVMVIFGNKMAGALAGDLGPTSKIGEGSIRLHELLHPPAPDPCARRDANGFCQRIRDASIGEDVLFFAFPGSAFTSGINQSNAERLAGERAAQLFAALKMPG